MVVTHNIRGAERAHVLMVMEVPGPRDITEEGDLKGTWEWKGKVEG